MRISDWSSDVCSSDLLPKSDFSPYLGAGVTYAVFYNEDVAAGLRKVDYDNAWGVAFQAGFDYRLTDRWYFNADVKKILLNTDVTVTTSNGTVIRADTDLDPWVVGVGRSEEHTSELQSLMRISYAVFGL